MGVRIQRESDASWVASFFGLSVIFISDRLQKYIEVMAIIINQMLKRGIRILYANVLVLYDWNKMYVSIFHVLQVYTSDAQIFMVNERNLHFVRTVARGSSPRNFLAFSDYRFTFSVLQLTFIVNRLTLSVFWSMAINA